jgi:ATP synthase F1 gamma subunit
MPVLDELRADLGEIETLKFISAAFAEAASVRIGKIRNAFENNSRYFHEISQLYHLVKVSAGVDEKLHHQKKAEGKTLSVAVTSNHRFYGLLNINTMQTFVEDTEKLTTDRLIVGQTGTDYLRIIGYSHQIESVRFSNDYPSPDEIRSTVGKLANYSKVYLFFPKFETMLRQSVEMVDLTETAKPDEITSEQMVKQIFEPELGKIIEFFDVQIKAILFQRAMLESDLSRTAARLLSMSAAEERADKLTKEKRTQIGKVKSTILNTQLMETFTGRKLWKK